MSHRCSPCQSLSIDSLLSLAKAELSNHSYGGFPEEFFFQHHPSFKDLEDAASRGCHLCGLVLSSFKGAPVDMDDGVPYEWPEEWVEEQDWDPEASMYTLAKSLPESPVWFALGASHVYTAASLADFRQFDKLLVQVGVKEKDTYRETMEWYLPSLSLIISTPGDEAFFVDGFRIARNELVPDLAAPENFEIARQWLKSCIQKHDGCPADSPRVLPARVVDAGVDPGFGDVKIMTSEGAKGRYLALSHCWGGKITPLLTHETFDSFSSSLPYNDLPANFKDAIRITRELGFRYVWIDSLCIIQDSPSDWAQESTKMAQIYRDSVLTISALSSSGSTMGILRNLQKKPAQSQPEPVFMTLMASGSGHDVSITRDRQCEYLASLTNHCPLESRGWCLQESILSPRHLYYGLEQIYWRCPHGYQDAEGSSPGGRFPSDMSLKSIAAVLYSDVLKLGEPAEHAAFSTGETTIQAAKEEYYKLVSTYSGRTLTFGSDKFPAFSGIARRMHHAAFGGGNYLAGVWATDLAPGLLWIPEMKTARRAPGPYRAPTWSWAVTDDKIWFGSTWNGASGDSETGGSSTKSSLSRLELVSSDMRLRDLADPYGQVRAGSSITVCGPARTLRRSGQVLDGALGHCASLGCVTLDGESTSDAAGGRLASLELFLDGDELLCIPVMAGDGPSEGWEVDRDLVDEERRWLVLVAGADVETDEDGRVERGAGLVLEWVEGEDEYQRAGTANFMTRRTLCLEQWETRTLKLV
ncbi:hypothetical protein RB595_000240 [Gaeumannomyces hyphopodioides]